MANPIIFGKFEIEGKKGDSDDFLLGVIDDMEEEAKKWGVKLKLNYQSVKR